jgi:crotonobetainyl-CoA:carnitine CoA-transferase CaiB-like acyl-CoA transferase
MASQAEAETPSKPLRGVRVVEAGSYFSAPLASMMLADLGAQVVKVEPPDGDPFRRFSLRHNGVSAAWANVNHGKTVTALDLKTDEDRAALMALLADADVFIQNWRPGVDESLGLPRSLLANRFSSLIRVRITGFGEHGARSSLPVFDGLLQAASGFSAREAGPDGVPRLTRTFIADKVTALFAAQSILAALLQRRETGKGCDLDLSMLDVMAYFNFPELGQDRTFLPPAPAVDLSSTRSALLRTIDGHVLVSPVTGRQIKSALEAVGHPEWKDELKAQPSPSRLLNELLNRLESVTATWTTQECEKRFHEHDVPATAVLSFDEHIADEQTVRNEVYGSSPSDFGPLRRVRYPARIDGTKLPLTPAAPQLTDRSRSDGWLAPEDPPA